MARYAIAGLTLLFLLSEIGQLCLGEECIESEKQALLKFKASILHDPSHRLSSWNPKTNCCQWHGITCHNVTSHVLKLHLPGGDKLMSNNSLEATRVDPSLLELQHLIYLDLSGIDFNGIPIPVFFGSMEHLRYLSISDANFTRKIPPNLGNLTNLLFLDLSQNYDLHSNDMNWVSNLQSLQHLNLNSVNLGQAHNLFQVLHMLPSLLQLQLAECELYNLSTPIPPINFTNNNVGVQVLNLADNEIDGRILGALRNWTSILSLDLSSNNLSSLPSWLGEFKNLVTLDLSSNSLSGNIPQSLGQLVNLIFLVLSGNSLSGTIPQSLGQLVNLTYLDLLSNFLSGNIPQSLGQLVNLTFLNLSSNSLSGNIPQSLGQLVNLIFLALSSNSLSGTISQSLGQLVNLTFLDLLSNPLSGNIPQSLDQLVNLIDLNLYNSSVSGNIPQSLGQLVNLMSLVLSSNSLSGNIPQNLGQLVNLTFLDLSNNSLSGNIPQSFDQLVNLHFLTLSRNYLHGIIPNSLSPRNNLINSSIPKFLCQSESLQHLDLSYNNFSGEIPNCWRANGLMEINFSFNKLLGDFPISFGKLSSLLWLHLNNNNLEGKLPLTLRNLKQLRLMDLGENRFSGSIPSWTSKTFPTLQILRLRDNMLDGNIPLHLCQLTSLHILDLANNNLSGSIPSCIGNLIGMTKHNVDERELGNSTLINDLKMDWPSQEVKQIMKGRELDFIRILQFVVNMDLSNNNLIGSIPIGVYLLTGLIGLNLSHNHLKGEIPEMIGNMKSLESFDISCNQIAGTIPKSMPTLTSLSHLNMSNNNLSGPIPTENQFLTLNDPSIYVGNRYLCGIPLPNKCPGDETHQAPEAKESEDENDSEKVWFYFVIAIGFAVGFWGVIGTLVLKKNWRYACFQRVEDVADEIYMYTVIKVAKLKRMLRNHVHG